VADSLSVTSANQLQTSALFANGLSTASELAATSIDAYTSCSPGINIGFSVNGSGNVDTSIRSLVNDATNHASSAIGSTATTK